MLQVALALITEKNFLLLSKREIENPLCPHWSCNGEKKLSTRAGTIQKSSSFELLWAKLDELEPAGLRIRISHP